MINTTPMELLRKLGPDNKDNKHNKDKKDNKDNKDNKYNEDLLTNNILELTINEDRELIEAAIRLYNDL